MHFTFLLLGLVLSFNLSSVWAGRGGERIDAENPRCQGVCESCFSSDNRQQCDGIIQTRIDQEVNCTECFRYAPCASNEDCAGWRCDINERKCYRPECIDDGDCPNGVCTQDNICVECREDANCEGDLVCCNLCEICVECVDDTPCEGRADGKFHCDTDEQICVECLDDGDCPDGVCTQDNICDYPSSTTIPPEDPSSTTIPPEDPSSTTIPPEECTDEIACPQLDNCLSNTCENGNCVQNYECSADEVCEDNQCVIPPECNIDEDCLESETCLSNTCVNRDCPSFEDCMILIDDCEPPTCEYGSTNAPCECCGVCLGGPGDPCGNEQPPCADGFVCRFDHSRHHYNSAGCLPGVCVPDDECEEPEHNHNHRHRHTHHSSASASASAFARAGAYARAG